MSQPPLAGVRVLDLGSMVAAPLAATLLADLGADCIKIEPPGGEEGRRIGPPKGDDSGLYIGTNRNKRGIVLDLRTPPGSAVLARLLAGTDVLVHNVRGPARARLGLDAETLHERYPRLITVTLSTYGETGPWAGRPGIDPSAQALGGLMGFTGVPDGAPVKAGPAVADVTAATLAAYGALGALRARDRDGLGQHVEVALVDGVVHLQPVQLGQYLLHGEAPPRTGNGSIFYAPYNAYACADGLLVHVAAYVDKFFDGLCQALELPELLADPRFATAPARLAHVAQLDAVLIARFRQRPRGAWMARLAAVDTVAAPVLDYPGVVADPQLAANGVWAQVQHTVHGPLTVPAPVVHLSRTPAQVTRAPPALGEHTAQVLAELGYGPEAISELMQ